MKMKTCFKCGIEKPLDDLANEPVGGAVRLLDVLFEGMGHAEKEERDDEDHKSPEPISKGHRDNPKGMGPRKGCQRREKIGQQGRDHPQRKRNQRDNHVGI